MCVLVVEVTRNCTRKGRRRVLFWKGRRRVLFWAIGKGCACVHIAAEIVRIPDGRECDVSMERKCEVTMCVG